MYGAFIKGYVKYIILDVVNIIKIIIIWFKMAKSKSFIESCVKAFSW